MERVLLAGAPPPVHAPSIGGAPVAIALSPATRLVASDPAARVTAPESASLAPALGLPLGAPPRILVASQPGSPPIAVGDAPSDLRMPMDPRRAAAPEPADDPVQARPIAHLTPPTLVFPKATVVAAGATVPSTPASEPKHSSRHTHSHTPSHPHSPAPPPEPASYPRIEMPSGDFMFPLAVLPKQSWHSGGCNFGAPRGARLHAGCDLKEPKGTQIYAIADGILVQPPYHFYEGTHALEVQHGPYLVRYGEILAHSYTGGKTVKKGEPICKIGMLNSKNHKQMLHFEMYSNGASRRSLSGGGPYKRRSDLMNPTKLLDEWAKKLTG
jgi:hypothetical protein